MYPCDASFAILVRTWKEKKCNHNLLHRERFQPDVRDNMLEKKKSEEWTRPGKEARWHMKKSLFRLLSKKLEVDLD